MILRQIWVEGIRDLSKEVKLLGYAREQEDGTWHCVALVSGALCIIECQIGLSVDYVPGL